MLLHHQVVGNGPAVLLLHAGVADSRMWTPQVQALVDYHTVVTADLRGYGQSPLPPEPYSHATDVIELLNHLGIDRVALVGASFGGYVAQQIATAISHRVSRLVLLCAPTDGVEATVDIKEFGDAENRELEAGDIAAATELNVRTWLGPDADADAANLLRTTQRHAFEVQTAAGDVESDDPLIDLGAVTCPTVVVSGAHDLDVFGRYAERLVERISSAQHIVLDWAGHLPSLERPAETAQLVRDLLTRR